MSIWHLADETIGMEVKLGGGETNDDTADIGEVGGGDYVPKGRSIAHPPIIYSTISCLFLCRLILRQLWGDCGNRSDLCCLLRAETEIVQMKMDGTKVGSDSADGIDQVRETMCYFPG